MAASRVDARGPRMPGACWGCAGQGWTSGGALQDGPGQGGAGEGGQGKGRHCIEDESSNNRSRIVGQTQPTPFPLCIPPLVTTCPQPSPTIVPVSSRRPGSSIVFANFSHPLCQALNGQLGPRSGHSFSG